MQLYVLQSNVQCPPWKETCVLHFSVDICSDTRRLWEGFAPHILSDLNTQLRILHYVTLSYHKVISNSQNSPNTIHCCELTRQNSRMLFPCDEVRQLRDTCERVQSGVWAATLASVCTDQLTRVTLAASAVFVETLWTELRYQVYWHMLVSWNFYSMQDLFDTSAEWYLHHFWVQSTDRRLELRRI